jgi:hypothetical protein
MPFRLLPLAAALTLALTAPSTAGEFKQNPKAVLELFTSQGCSSCPAADALLEELAAHPEIIALAYHVDYWDYIGWPDTFGAEAHSNRQRDYATSWGSSRIFTPQLIVNGREGVVASRKTEVQGAVDGAALELPVTLTADGGMLEVDIPPDAALEEAVVWLVSYLDKADVKIDRGENEGKTIAYTQIVTGRQILGMWEPGTGAQLKLPLAEILTEPANGGVIIVQQERAGLPGRILGAASFLR